MFKFLKYKHSKVLIVSLVLLLLILFIFYRLSILSEDFEDVIDIPPITEESSIDFSEAPESIGSKLWVEGEIDHVFMSDKGNYFINFCSDFRICPFNAVIFSKDTRLFSDIKAWDGEVIYVYGLIEVYQNRPQIIIKNPNQIKFKAKGSISEKKEVFPVDEKLVKVVNVVDGDTVLINLEGTVELVRLIGVDAPEIKGPYSEEQCYGKESYEYLKDILNGEMIVIKSEDDSSDRDKYNRLLRFVYLSDGTLLNSHLIEEGYAFVYSFVDFSEKDNFLLLERKARDSRVGLWSEKCDYYKEQ